MPHSPEYCSYGGGEGLVTKLCVTLWDLMDCSLLGFSVHEILQARILEWLPFPLPGDFPCSGIQFAFPALAGGFFTIEPPGKPNL